MTPNPGFNVTGYLQVEYLIGMCGIHFFKFRFGFGSVLEKNSDSVRNEFGSVRFAKTRFGSDSYLLLT